MEDNCIICGKKLLKGHKTPYCKEHLIQHQREEKVKKWLETGDTGMGVDTTIRGPIRDYILQDQNCKCAICGIENNWNNMPINFVLDHIDGNASNSCRSNLRLICPNCDSQLPTYKSRNKKSARNARREWEKDNIIKVNN